MQAIDEAVVSAVPGIHSPVSDWIMTAFTYLGYFWFVIPIVYFLIKKRRAAAIMAFAALALGYICGNLILKNLVARPRPYTVLDISLIIPEPSEYLPSPRVTRCNSFSAATVLFYQQRRLTPAVAYCGIALACVIAFSRLYIACIICRIFLAGALMVSLSVRAVVLIVNAAEKRLKKAQGA